MPGDGSDCDFANTLHSWFCWIWRVSRYRRFTTQPRVVMNATQLRCLMDGQRCRFHAIARGAAAKGSTAREDKRGSGLIYSPQSPTYPCGFAFGRYWYLFRWRRCADSRRFSGPPVSECVECVRPAWCRKATTSILLSLEEPVVFSVIPPWSHGGRW